MSLRLMVGASPTSPKSPKLAGSLGRSPKPGNPPKPPIPPGMSKDEGLTTMTTGSSPS